MEKQCQLLKERLEKVNKLASSYKKGENESNNQLKEMIVSFSEGLGDTTKKEMLLGIKSRELEKVNLEHNQLKRKYGILVRRCEDLEKENTKLMVHLKILEDVQKKNLKYTIREKVKSQELTKHMDHLEECIIHLNLPIKETDPNGVTKIKNSLNALMKENQTLKKDLRGNSTVIEGLKKNNSIVEAQLNSLQQQLKMKKNQMSSSFKMISRTMSIAPANDCFIALSKYSNLNHWSRNLTSKRIKLLQDISDYGAQNFAIDTREQKDKKEVLARIEFVTQYLLDIGDFLEKVFKLIAMTNELYCKKTISNVLQDFTRSYSRLFSCEAAHIWLYSKVYSKLTTYSSHTEVTTDCSEPASEVIKSVIAYNSMHINRFTPITNQGYIHISWLPRLHRLSIAVPHHQAHRQCRSHCNYRVHQQK